MHDFGLWEDARVTGEKTGTERSCKLNVDMIPSLTFLLWGGGANCSATLMPVMYFYNFIKMLIEICGSLRGCASPESHWPTTKPVLLNDGSITLSTASPDLFTSVGGADSKPALICEKDNSGGPTNSGILWQMSVRLHAARQWAHDPLKDMKPSVHLHEVCFRFFDQKHSQQLPAAGHFVELRQCFSSSSFHGGAARELQTFYGPV